ncbi:MAG: (2Fe-2S) ferredoxin domain-containing protein [Cyanobacteria bacterium J06639_14]
MMNTSINSSPIFNLEGTLLGFLGGDFGKPKSIILEVEEEQIVIKLPKELRPSIQRWVKVGDRLQCVGRSRIDFKAGVIKLKAYQVFYPPQSEAASPVTAPAVATHPSVKRDACAKACNTDRLPTSGQKPAKILICQKSGCQKRGGRQIVAALQQVLQDYQLQDQVEIRYTGCQKRCSKSPTLTIMPGKHSYDRLNPKDLSALITEHFCPPDSLAKP